jgi:hypothetical protein
MKGARTWYHFQSLFSVPMLFERSRSMAMTLSFPLDKNFAVVGESGSMKYINGETATVKHPMKMKILCM